MGRRMGTETGMGMGLGTRIGLGTDGDGSGDGDRNGNGNGNKPWKSLGAGLDSGREDWDVNSRQSSALPGQEFWECW